ncbi:MAG: hypothetical protein A2X94_08735 [Bdellovibrionales bacterium GWB1_55_8]|nr:MAG: hypothetical protein A2X94_08735 [Bdellovibrionales bacterium GWB1_55_8]
MKARIVSFHCVLKNKMGKVLSSTFNQDVITGGSNDSAPLKDLSKALQDLKKGEKRKVFLSAREAYGFYDQRLAIEMPRVRLDPKRALTVGMEVLVSEGSGSTKRYRIVGLTRDTLQLDGNHPLAGQDLEFEIEGVAARDATADEVLESDPIKPGEWLH